MTHVVNGITSAGWGLGRSVWRYVEFVVSGLLFAFLGVELTSVLGTSDLLGNGRSLAVGAATIGVLLATRSAAMFGSSYLSGRRASGVGSAVPYGWREAAIASWAGMRGVVTVATALALPDSIDSGNPFPARNEVVLVGLLVVLVTLVVQGLTLSPLIRRLGVASDADPAADARRLHRTVTEAAPERLSADDEMPTEVRRAVIHQYESRLHYRQMVEEIVDVPDDGAKRDQRLRQLLGRASEAEREAVLQARRRGEVSASAADDVLFDIEARALRYDS
jgi:CPA1 family monovalent cation:H+ antiporter